MHAQVNNQEQSHHSILPPNTFGITGPESIQVEIWDAVPSAPTGVMSLAERDVLVTSHMPIVRYVARRIHERVPQHIEMDDLVAAGLVGLIDAASRFDTRKQVQFKSYAQFRIRGAILDSLRMSDWSPRELRRKGREIAEATRVLSGRLGRTATDAEIAEEMGVSLSDFQQMTGELKGLEVTSLFAERSEAEGEIEMEAVAAPMADSPLAQCIAGQTREQLATAIAALPEKERLVLTLSYYEELTLREIGSILGVVESRVCQIRSAAIVRLRKFMTTSTTPSSPSETKATPKKNKRCRH